MQEKKTPFLLVFVVILLFFIVGAVTFYFYVRVNSLENKIESAGNVSEEGKEITGLDSSTTQKEGECGIECQNYINSVVSRAIATISSSTKETVIEKEVTTKTPKTSYINMGTTYTTTSTDWYTLDDTAVYIDLVKEYGEAAKVSWEALLRVAHGNGQAYARLWDDTNKIAVDGSELTTINNSTYQFVSTTSLPFWRGRNLYKIQIKSLNSFEVTITDAKIKIMY
jgi:hypothetical protein